MRLIILVTLTLLILTACEQNKSSKVTVVFFNNQNLNSNITVDTLLKAKELDLSETPIDLFFSCKNFQIPYYVPTEGIFKNVTKEKECDMKIYPNNVKCYEYDNKNRVIKMNVSGSGTINNFTYKYNDKNQIILVTDFATKFILTYNADGNLSELTQTEEPFSKKLVFIYE